MKTINRKIPGFLPPPPKTENDGKIADLSSKTLLELLELKNRQEKLLKNKPFISKLADKGLKIKTFLDKILTEIKSKQNEEETCRMLHNLKLTGLDKASIGNVEWKGRVRPGDEQYLDSDDDSDPEDVLHILSTSQSQEKTVKIQPPEKPLITPEDLEKISEIPHIKYLVDITENKANVKTKHLFKPYKSTVTDVHDSTKEVLRKKNKHWENTSATPPPMLHAPAKLLTIEESLSLQKEHNHHLKEVEARHAAEKLAVTKGIQLGDLPRHGANFVGFREVDSDHSESDPEGSDKEVHDEDLDRGGVVFTVMK